MYEFVDRRTGELDQASRFFVWSIRGWVHSMAQGRCPPAALASAFARSDMLGGLPHFHLAMLALNRDGLENFHFAPLTCDRVSEDEAVLLSLVHRLLDGDEAAAQATAALLVGEDAVQSFGRGLALFSARLAARFPVERVGLDAAVKGDE